MNEFFNQKLAFLKSNRFWMVVVIAILQGLVSTQVISSDVYVILTQLFQGLLGVTVTIGTVDKFGKSIGGN